MRLETPHSYPAVGQRLDGPYSPPQRMEKRLSRRGVWVRLSCHPGLVKFEGDSEFDNQVFMNFKDKLESFSQHRRLWGTTRALNFILGGLLQRLGVSINYVFVGADDGLRTRNLSRQALSVQHR